ncbi:MAG: glycosyltransferase, partial [Patescibacteria group bacterium]
VNNEIGKPYFLYVGSRVDYKNFKLLLDSFSSWEFKNKYDLLCIGGGNFKEEEVFYIDKLGLSDNVFYLENVCDYDLVYYYNCAEAFIYPSLYEGFGMPILESIACGTPVICSDIEIFREIGKDLPLFFKDKNGLLECLNKVVSGYEFGDREYANLINNYSWRETTSKTFEFYKKILKK